MARPLRMCQGTEARLTPDLGTRRTRDFHHLEDRFCSMRTVSGAGYARKLHASRIHSRWDSTTRIYSTTQDAVLLTWTRGPPRPQGTEARLTPDLGTRRTRDFHHLEDRFLRMRTVSGAGYARKLPASRIPSRWDSTTRIYSTTQDAVLLTWTRGPGCVISRASSPAGI